MTLLVKGLLFGLAATLTVIALTVPREERDAITDWLRAALIGLLVAAAIAF